VSQTTADSLINKDNYGLAVACTQPFM